MQTQRTKDRESASEEDEQISHTPERQQKVDKERGKTKKKTKPKFSGANKKGAHVIRQKPNNKSNSNIKTNTYVSGDDSNQSNAENSPGNSPDQSPRVDLAYEESEYMNVSPAHILQRSDDNAENMTSAQLVWAVMFTIIYLITKL